MWRVFVDFTTLGKAQYFSTRVTLSTTFSTVRELDISDLPDGTYKIECLTRIESNNGTKCNIIQRITDQSDTVIGGESFTQVFLWRNATNNCNILKDKLTN